MTSDLGKLLLQIQVDGQGKISGIAKEAQQAEGSFAGMNGKMIATGALIAGVVLGIQRMVQALSESVKMYSESELNATALSNALYNVGNNSAMVNDELKRQSRALQNNTAYEDDAIVKTQALLLTYGKTTDEVKALIPFIIDLASKMSLNSGRTVDLQTATTAYFRVLDGQDRALKPYGINLDDVVLKSRDAVKITNELKDVVSGAGESFAGTTQGQMEKYANSLGMLKEAWGKFFVETFRPQIEGLRALFEIITPSDMTGTLLSSYEKLIEVGGLYRDKVLFGQSAEIFNQIEAMKKLGTLSESMLRVEINRLVDLQKQNGEYYIAEQTRNNMKMISLDLLTYEKEQMKISNEANVALKEKLKSEDEQSKQKEYQIELDKMALEIEKTREKIRASEEAEILNMDLSWTEIAEGKIREIGGSVVDLNLKLSETQLLAQKIDDLFRNQIAQSAGDFFTGEKIDGGRVLKSVLRSIIVELTTMLIKSLTLKAIFTALGFISGGVSSGLGGSVSSGVGGGVGGGGLAVSLSNLDMPVLSGGNPGVSGPIANSGNNVTIIIQDTMPLTSNYEKMKVAGQYLEDFEKVSNRSRI